MKCVSCKCAHKCSINFSAEDKSDINQRFQCTKNAQLRHQYIVDRIKSGIRKQVTVHENSRKKQTWQYFLDKKVNEEHGVDKCERIQVCRIVFYETLQVNERFVRHAIDTAEGGISKEDHRGKNNAYYRSSGVISQNKKSLLQKRNQKDLHRRYVQLFIVNSCKNAQFI